MYGLNIIDLIVIGIYVLVITGLGVLAKGRIKESGDFFMGNRGFGKILMIAQAFGSGTHTDQPVSVSGAAYTNGLAGIWYQWMWLFSTPFYWLIAPIYRRLRYVTMADFFKERYGSFMAILYTFMGIMYFSMDIGIMLKGTGVTIEGLTGGALNEGTIIIIATALFLAYGLAGGLVAAVFTDLIQSVLILVLSFLLVPFALNKIGGMEVLHQELPEHMFSLIAPTEVTLFFIIMIIVNGLVGVVVQPHHMAIGGSGKTEIACRIGWTYGNFLKRIATMGWAFIGLFAVILIPDLAFEDRELAFGILSRDLLPVGLVGLMISALIAAVMSTCDAFMVHASALFTKNIYLEYVKPGASEKTQLLVARLTSLIVVLLGIVFAFSFPSVVSGLMEVWKVTAYLGIAFWLGVIWKRANRWGALFSVVGMAGSALYTDFFLDWTLAYQIALYLPVGLILMIMFSLLTKPEPEEQSFKFYKLLDTPVGKENELKECGVEIKLEGVSEGPQPAGAKRSWTERLFKIGDARDRLLIVDLLTLRKNFNWQSYRTDIVGFIGAIGIVAMLMISMVLLAKIGA